MERYELLKATNDSEMAGGVTQQPGDTANDPEMTGNGT